MSQSLFDDIQWLKAVIDLRIDNLSSFTSEPLIVAPDISQNNDNYAHLVSKLGLDSQERLILCLALAPAMGPELLDGLKTVNPNNNAPYSEVGGVFSKTSASVIPTAETALFLVSGVSLERRIAMHGLFEERESILFSHNLIHLQDLPSKEPTLSGRIYPSKECKALLLRGKTYLPKYDSQFPASILETSLTWDDLVINHNTADEIEEIKIWLEHGKRLISDQEIGSKMKRGYRGLFYGPSGTGKTLTASLLGQNSGHPVYRVDLSMVVSKYIGETEKNLANIFNQAEHKDWILFFDEADALFGKRTQTSSSNDRHANQEISYLLQRIEDFAGLIILSSNFKSNMDTAFIRRFQSITHFPVPDEQQKMLLFKKAFKGNYTLDEDIPIKTVCKKYELSGGNIHNILRYCAMMVIHHDLNSVSEEIFTLGLHKELKKMGKSI